VPLTPEDVRNKRFTPVRLREGYDMGEVDQFLDEVETELERLTGENSELRDRLEAVATAPPAEPAPQQVEAEPEPEPVVEQEPEPEPQPEPAPVAPPVVVTGPTVVEASSAAARLLEIATRNADEVVVDAKEQAVTIIGEARAEAERIDQESRAAADRVESDARTGAEQLASEADARRQQLIGDLERQRDTLAGEVEHLQVFEREYRSRLKNYFEAQLAELAHEPNSTLPVDSGEVESGSNDSGPDDAGSNESGPDERGHDESAPNDAHAAKRLRSLLGDERS